MWCKETTGSDTRWYSGERRGPGDGDGDGRGADTDFSLDKILLKIES